MEAVSIGAARVERDGGVYDVLAIARAARNVDLSEDAISAMHATQCCRFRRCCRMHGDLWFLVFSPATHLFAAPRCRLT
jgi:hypothetical protein